MLGGQGKVAETRALPEMRHPKRLGHLAQHQSHDTGLMAGKVKLELGVKASLRVESGSGSRCLCAV